MRKARNNAYIMKLEDGLAWLLTANKGVERWLEKLASIMELEDGESGAYPKLCFAPTSLGTGSCLASSTPSDPSTRLTGFQRWEYYELGCVRLWSRAGTADITCELLKPHNHEMDLFMMWEAVFPIYSQAINVGGLPLHAGLAEWRGGGVLLAGRSDVGKSTCCQRLPRSWNVLCDDEALIALSPSVRYMAHPFPTWSDHIFKRSTRTWNVQRQVPVSAVFFLEQAKVDEVERIGQEEAAIRIYHLADQVCFRNWRPENSHNQGPMRKKLFNNACDLARTIPAFVLRVTLTGDFWREMESTLTCSTSAKTGIGMGHF
jgi:SynChlorMet cassette protein ScmC